MVAMPIGVAAQAAACANKAVVTLFIDTVSVPLDVISPAFVRIWMRSALDTPADRRIAEACATLSLLVEIKASSCAVLNPFVAFIKPSITTGFLICVNTT